LWSPCSKDNDGVEPVTDGDANENPIEDDRLTKSLAHQQQLMKTAKRYQARKTQQTTASLTRSLTKSLTSSVTSSHNFSQSASLSISHRLQSVSRAYKKQSTLTRSRSNTAASTKDEDTVAETNVPYHTIIIDCAPITFVDSMGIRALYQV